MQLLSSSPFSPAVCCCLRVLSVLQSAVVSFQQSVLKFSFLVHTWTRDLPSSGLVSGSWSARGLPASQLAAPSPPASQPAAIQPASSQAKTPPQAPKVSILPLKPTKTTGFHRFLLYPSNGLESTFWVPVAPQMTPNDLKVHPRSCPGSPKWSLKAPKVTTQLPKIAQWHPMCTQWLPTSNQRHPKHSKSEPKGP